MKCFKKLSSQTQVDYSKIIKTVKYLHWRGKSAFNLVPCVTVWKRQKKKKNAFKFLNLREYLYIHSKTFEENKIKYFSISDGAKDRYATAAVLSAFSADKT